MCLFKALRRGHWLTHGIAKVYVQIPSKQGITSVTHGPSPWDLELVVREKWFGLVDRGVIFGERRILKFSLG